MALERLEEIRAGRLKKREQLIAAGLPPYPTEVRRTHTVQQVLENFETIVDGGQAVEVLGRIMGIRRHGGLAFLDLHDASDGIQLQATKDKLSEDIFGRLDLLDAGDWVAATGKLIKTQRGVVTIELTNLVIISKSIRPLPDNWYGLKDHEARYRQRELDILLNEKTKQTVVLRSIIIDWLRHYFHEQGYLEVETPILQTTVGGAAARPFTTHHNALDADLHLRIAAEIHLKRLLVAGLEKVFEIERRFRNEGLSRQHNPEFTMLESQWAFADYEDVMGFTDELFERLITDITGGSDITWQGTTVSFAKPIKRLRYVDVVSEKLGVDILKEKNPKAYIPLFAKHQLETPEITTYPKLVDELYKELIRPTLIQPVHLYDYPVEMAPLAKPGLHNPAIAEKTQLLAFGLELTNSYTELNDPVVQQQFFEEQRRRSAAGDMEAHADDEYVRSMEYGMPPNVGFGLGVDRLIMLLADVPNIRDTILFPLLKPDHD